MNAQLSDRRPPWAPGGRLHPARGNPCTSADDAFLCGRLSGQRCQIERCYYPARYAGTDDQQIEEQARNHARRTIRDIECYPLDWTLGWLQGFYRDEPITHLPTMRRLLVEHGRARRAAQLRAQELA